MSNSLRSRLTPLGIALLLAACAADRPAPVESRTIPPPAAVRAAPAPASAALPPKAADPVGVQARPVPSAGVQVRPLPGSGDARAQPPAGAIRSQPQGLKKPYSEAALAELRGQAAVKPASSAADAPADSKPDAPKADAPKADAPKADSPKADSPKADSAKPDATKPEAREPRSAGASDFAWPAKGRLIQGFAEPRNMGIAIAGTPGDPVQAAADGKVIFSGAGPRGYGNLLIIRHEGDTLTVYAHNRALLVKDGAQVKRGQQIAELGDSGTDRPKLHFEIRKGGRPIDPITLLPSR